MNMDKGASVSLTHLFNIPLVCVLLGFTERSKLMVWILWLVCLYLKCCYGVILGDAFSDSSLIVWERIIKFSLMFKMLSDPLVQEIPGLYDGVEECLFKMAFTGFMERKKTSNLRILN